MFYVFRQLLACWLGCLRHALVLSLLPRLGENRGCCPAKGLLLQEREAAGASLGYGFMLTRGSAHGMLVPAPYPAVPEQGAGLALWEGGE